MNTTTDALTERQERTALPPIGRPMDNTALSMYMTCPREFDFAMLQHRRTKEDSKSAALTYGSAWHTVLENHYKSGADPAVMEQTFKKIKEDWPASGEGDHRTPQRLIVDYVGYIKKWGNDCLDTVGAPDSPLVEVSINAMAGDLVHSYAGKVDRVVKVGSQYYIEDHKTTSRLDRHYFSQFSLSNQMKGYVYLARHLFPDLDIRGVRINVLHLLKGASGYERHLETYSPAILDEWADNTNIWLRRIQQDIAANGFPGHFGDNGCSRKYGMCQYYKVCSASPRIRPKILELDYEINPWNPLTLGDNDDD